MPPLESSAAPTTEPTPTPAPDAEPSPSPRALANRRNSLKSTGPKTLEGKERSRKNAWKHGQRAEAIVDEADLRAVDEAIARYAEVMKPECHFEADLVRSAAVASVRKRRCERAEQAALLPKAAAAVRDWEQKRRKAIRRRAQDLLADPPAVVADLEASGFGCDWLIRRWEQLDRPIALGLSWGPSDLIDAHALLGRAPDEPDDALAAEVRRLAGAAAASEGDRARLRDLIASEVDRLAALLDEAREAVDLPEREAVRLAALIDTSREGQLRHRYDRDAELSTHRNANLLLRLRRDEARLQYRAQQLARASIVSRSSVGGGWWREVDADPAPPGFEPIRARVPASPAADRTVEPPPAPPAATAPAAARPAPNEAKSPASTAIDPRRNSLKDHLIRDDAPAAPPEPPRRTAPADPGPRTAPTPGRDSPAGSPACPAESNRHRTSRWPLPGGP